MKMDHHCYWIGNCIGLYNIKFFFQYGLYVMAANLVIMATYFAHIKDIWSTLTWA